MDANKTSGEEARRQLHKNVASNVEQVLAATPTRHLLYGHLPPITKTIEGILTRHAGHCWRSKDELISDVLLCCPEDLPETMNDREKWRERVRDIRASGTT